VSPLTTRTLLFWPRAQVSDDVVYFLVAQIRDPARSREPKHSRVGPSVLDGFAQEPVRGLTQKTCVADGSAGPTHDVAVTLYAVTRGTDLLEPERAKSRVATCFALGIDFGGAIRLRGM
jgi:hypothetical protein